MTRIQPDDLYRTLAEATLDKVYIVDRNGVVLHANTSAAQCFSTKPAELVGKSLSVLCPPEKSEKYLKSIREVFETGRPLAIGLSDALHGNEVGEQSFLSPVKNKKGRIAAVLVTSSGDGRDARAAEALRESGMLYQDLANNPSAGVYRIRVRHLSPWSAPEAPPYVYEFVNDRYCELTGIPAEKHYSDPTVTLRQIHPDEYENWAALNERANRTGEPFFWEGRVVVKGQLRWFHYESRSRSLPNGDLLWTGILLDITERKQLESAVELIAKKYSTVFDNVSDGMWIIDLRGRIVEVNDSYCRMSGYRRSELIGMHIKKLEGLESAAAIAAHMKKIIECGQDRFETRHRRKDGSHIALEVVTLSMALEGGRIAMLARDITKRKRAEEELRNSEQRYRGTLNLLGDMIHVVDAGLNVVLANQVLRQLNRRLGLREDFIGENLFKVYPFLTAKVRREYEKVIATGEPLVTEELNRIAGAEFSTETRKIPIFEGGRVKQVLTVMRDVSERLRAQKNQERLQGEILSALTRQQIMIGQTLHDSLGQLLTGISYMVKGLEHDLKRGKPPAAKETAR
ncbi:MAG TPA: PAS domain S-box protein, partial [Elusimicrobiota bacterium]|nr:PAS domain S-box protein [Elusimicrobiota bacterium]